MNAAVVQDAHEMADELAVLRQALHREPELGLAVPRTQEKVLTALQGLPLEISTGSATNSVTAVLRGTAEAGVEGTSSKRPVVLLRADMDALPVQEHADVPFASRFEGTMHACGHDLHTTMLVGAAHILAHHRDRLTGDVVLMFQPGEEGGDGAKIMLEEGVLEAAGAPVGAAYALHVFSGLIPRGQFVTRPGSIMSASDTLCVTVQGQGGHGSTPHLAKDPVTAASTMVTDLQTAVTRQFNVFDPVVVTVGSFHAGTQSNVIPDTARFEATIRTFSAAARERIMEAAPRLVRGIAAAHGLDALVEYKAGYPLTVNDAQETAHVASTVRDLFGADRFRTLDHSFCASEDFSRVLEAVPGSFVGLGATPADSDPAHAPFNHSPHAMYDDAVLPDGAALYAELAIGRLARPADRTPQPTAPHDGKTP